MKVDRKTKTEKSPPGSRAAKGGRRTATKTNGRHLLTAYEHIPIGIVETSLDGRYIEANEEFCRIMQYSRAELLQLGIKDCTHEDDYAIDSKLHEQLVAGKIPFYKLEKRFIRKSGEAIWVELTRTLICDEKGKPLYSVGVVLDISERKDVERVLRESVERLRLATQSARIFMWEWDLQNQIYTVDDNFEKVIGFSGGLLPKDSIDSVKRLMPPQDARALNEAVVKAIENHSDLQSLQIRFINPDNGERVWLEITGKIIYDDQGNAERMFGVTQNITERKQTQDQIAVISRVPEENPNPVMRLTPDGIILYANQACRELLEAWKQEIDRTIPNALLDAVSQAFATGMKEQIEIEHQKRTYSCTLAPILEAGYVNFYGNEITERKMAEAGLRLARRQAEQFADRMARLQKVTAALSGALTPPQVAEVVTNQGAPALGAVSSTVMQLVENGQFLEIMYSTSPESNTRPYQRFPVSLRVPAADVLRSGETVWIESRHEYLVRYPHLTDQINRWDMEAAIAVPMVYEEQIVGVLTLSFDRIFPYSTDDLEYALTLARQGAQALERAHAADALRESEERFRALVSQATAGITQSDTEGRLVFVNPRLCEMLGYSEEELLGKSVWELTDPDDLDDNQRLFRRMLDGGHSYQIEKRFLRKDHSRLWASVSVSSIRDLDANPKGGVGVIIDIEKRKQAERALAEFARQQEALYQLSDRLHRTDTLADVFNAALNAILSALQCDRASILLFDDRDVMRFVAWRGLSDRYRQATDGHSPWKPDAKDPKPIPMEDVRIAELDESLRAVILEEGIRSLAFIPLVSNEKLIGKFMVYFDSPHEFDEASLDLSMTIANQLAFGIERKRAEEALRIENERFMRFVNANIVGILIGNAMGEVILANDYYLRLLGVSREELLHGDIDWKRFTPPEWLPADEKAIQELRERGVCEPYEKEYIRTDGRRVSVYIADAMLPGPREEIAAFVVDITDRKRVEENLLLSEQKFSSIFYAAPFAIALQKLPDSRFANVNDAFVQLFGYEREELIGRTSQDVGLQPDETLRAKAIEQFQGQGFMRNEELQIKTKSGEKIWVSVSGEIVKIAGEDHVLSLAVDITARKQAEEALRESEERYRGIVNQTIAGIAETDLTGKFIMVNDRYCEIAGYRRDDLLRDRRMQDITHPDDLQKNLELFGRLAEDGISFEIEKRYIRPDGSIVWVHNSVSAIVGTDGRPRSAVAAVIDITERKRAEEILRRNEELFSTLVEAAPFGVYFIDSEFRLRAINKGSQAVFAGIDPLIGRDFAEILRILWQEPFATEAIERFRHTLRTGEPFISPPVIEQRANINEIQSYDWQIHRITMPDGTFGVVCYFYDLSEQKRMEAAVRASESLYRAIARNIPGGGLYVVDKDLRYLVAEGPVTEAFGLTREMLEGHTVMEVFPDERGTRMEERLRRTFAGETVSFETRSQDRVYWTRQAPLHESIGQAIILTLDITERKQAEEALRDSEERFRAILRQATAGIVRKDAEGRLIYVNEAFCNMLGYTEEELLGKTVWDFMHEDDRAENKRQFDRLMREGIPFNLERRLVREGGTIIWVDASVSPIMDATGRPQSAVTVEVDITRRKQAEEALQQLNLQLEERVLSRTAKLRAVNQTLREEIAERRRVEEALRHSEAAARANEEKLSTLFQLLPVGISFLDLKGKIIQMNPALANILKLPDEQLADQTYRSRKYIRADGTWMPPAEFASQRALTEGKTIYNVETGVLLENSEIVWTSVSAAPVAVADVGAVVVTVDVTESKRAERALQESRERLQILSQRLVEVQEEERRAIARELHDRVGQTLAALNINLIIISGQLAGTIDEQVGARLGDSMKLVAETITLVRDVMSNLRPSVLDDYGLEAALQSHINEYMSRYDIKVVMDKSDPSIPRMMPSIEMTFLRIAQEALMNIARHARAGQVNLSLRREADEICMIVEDNGVGIESWQRANRPGSHGLTIMRERAEAFGGNLMVSSAPQQGTRIEVRIPFEDRESPSGEKEIHL